MPIPDWLMKRPDFSDQDKYEAAGWVKTGKFDLPVRDGEIMEPCSIGTIDPLEKLATLTTYENESLGLSADELDFFDQGVVYTEWRPLKFKKGDPIGLALKAGDKHWRIKQLNETFDMWGDSKLIQGKRVTHKITLVIYSHAYGRRETVLKVEVVREED